MNPVVLVCNQTFNMSADMCVRVLGQTVDSKHESRKTEEMQYHLVSENSLKVKKRGGGISKENSANLQELLFAKAGTN